MEEKIERIFMRAFIIGDKHKKVIGEIAKACESDIAEALQVQGETFREIEDEWVERVRELMAQLAEMREALQKLNDLAQLMTTSDFAIDVAAISQKTLSAAPEVLWAVEGRWDTSEKGDIGRIHLVLPATTELPSGHRIGVGTTSPEPSERHGQQVKVIVMARKEAKDGLD